MMTLGFEGLSSAVCPCICMNVCLVCLSVCAFVVQCVSDVDLYRGAGNRHLCLHLQKPGLISVLYFKLVTNGGSVEQGHAPGFYPPLTVKYVAGKCLDLWFLLKHFVPPEASVMQLWSGYEAAGVCVYINRVGQKLDCFKKVYNYRTC